MCAVWGRPRLSAASPIVGSQEKARRGTQNGAKTAADPPRPGTKRAEHGATEPDRHAGRRSPPERGGKGAQGRGREGLGGRAKVPRGNRGPNALTSLLD